MDDLTSDGHRRAIVSCFRQAEEREQATETREDREEPVEPPANFLSIMLRPCLAASLPPTHVGSQVADRDSEDRVDAVLCTPVESVEETSLVQERDIGDRQWEDLNDKV